MKQALNDTGLTMLGLNTVRGNPDEFGLSALSGREGEARAAIDQAIGYAIAVGTPNVHVMAGFACGKAAHRCFVENLRHACAKAAPYSITILIEPLNTIDVPDYFLQTSAQAKTVIDEVGTDNIKLMFDCYHMQITEGDLITKLETLLPIIGHIQIASVPGRSEPDHGEVDYRLVFEALDRLGYIAVIGAEYRPATTTQAGLGWLARFK